MEEIKRILIAEDDPGEHSSSGYKIILTVLRKSKRLEGIKNLISELFEVNKVIEDQQDLIFLLSGTRS